MSWIGDAFGAESTAAAPFAPPFKLLTRLRWLFDIARALRYLHASNLTHGRLQPSSIFIDDNKRAVLGFNIDLDHRKDSIPWPFVDPLASLSDVHYAETDMFAFGALAQFLVSVYKPYYQSAPWFPRLQYVIDQCRSHSLASRPTADALCELLAQELQLAERVGWGEADGQRTPGPCTPPRLDSEVVIISVMQVRALR